MQLREMIESAATKAGNQANLAKVLGIHPEALYAAKAGRRGLPAFACFKLAELLDVDVKKVIAASELATEKNEDKRAFFAPFVLNAAAPLATVLAALTLTTAPNKVYANDSLFVTKTISHPVNSESYDNSQNVIKIMRS